MLTASHFAQCPALNETPAEMIPWWIKQKMNRAFSHDVTAAKLVFQNKRMAAMMVYQTNPLGIELYFYANTFLYFILFYLTSSQQMWGREATTA